MFKRAPAIAFASIFVTMLTAPLTAHSAGKPASKSDGPKLAAAAELSSSTAPFFISENVELSLQLKLKALSKATFKNK